MTLLHRGGKWYIRYYGPDGRQRWETIGLKAYNERTRVLGRPKSDRSMRAIDMVPSVYHALLALSVRTATGLAFPGPGGTPLPAWILYEHGFRPAIKRAEVNRIRFHDLRHTYASLLIMAGKHPKYIADQMGHASAAFTLDTWPLGSNGSTISSSRRASRLHSYLKALRPSTVHCRFFWRMLIVAGRLSPRQDGQGSHREPRPCP